jgi:hypothetical protein
LCHSRALEILLKKIYNFPIPYINRGDKND